MIAIGAFALFAELLPEDEWYDGGVEFIQYIFDHHINFGEVTELEKYDFLKLLRSQEILGLKMVLSCLIPDMRWNSLALLQSSYHYLNTKQINHHLNRN